MEAIKVICDSGKPVPVGHLGTITVDPLESGKMLVTFRPSRRLAKNWQGRTHRKLIDRPGHEGQNTR